MTCGNVWLRCCRLVRRGGTATPGRLPADDRAAPRGIVYVLRKSVSLAGRTR